jgi:SAM-dependent methyltransferase
MTTDTEHLQAAITAYWNTRGGEYDGQPRHGLLHEREKAAWLDALRELLPPPPATVLDVGCGTGFLALLCAELGYPVTGIDLAEGMLATAREKAAGLPAVPVFQIGDAADPPFPPAAFDVVVNRHLLWTLLAPDRAFAAWYRVLRPGGRLVAIDSLWTAERLAREQTEPPRPHPGYSAEMHAALPLRGLTSVEPVVALARAAGFAPVEVTMLEAIARVEREVLPESGHPFGVRYALVGRKPEG